MTLDLSEGGPVFSALDEMMMKLNLNDDQKNTKSQSNEAKNALKNLLRSGIPGIEGMFSSGSAPTASKGKGAGKLSGIGFSNVRCEAAKFATQQVFFRFRH